MSEPSKELILHHYDISPYAEKIRVAMGFKGLAWRSVMIPVVMPKPDLTALTGGYRLTPVLQVGADIYCDTKVIARRLERERPTPTLYPGGTAGIERALSFWAETLFMDIVTVGFSDEGFFPADFVADRQKMVPGGVDLALAKRMRPSRLDHIRAKLDLLDRQLADGRAYLLGEAASLADLSAYHPLWALRAVPATQPLFEPFRHLPAWMDRIAAFGHGERREMDSREAVEVARAATPATQSARDPGDPNGRNPGDRIQIFPEAYGRDPVVGELVWSDAHEIAIRRVDERAGEVVVHFPREGCVTLPA
jgi:glutathione S-transferase